jgi:hypothetical protein
MGISDIGRDLLARGISRPLVLAFLAALGVELLWRRVQQALGEALRPASRSGGHLQLVVGPDAFRSGAAARARTAAPTTRNAHRR